MAKYRQIFHIFQFCCNKFATALILQYQKNKGKNMTTLINIDIATMVRCMMRMRLSMVIERVSFAEIISAFTMLLFPKNPRWILFRCHVDGCCCRCCKSVC